MSKCSIDGTPVSPQYLQVKRTFAGFAVFHHDTPITFVDSEAIACAICEVVRVVATENQRVGDDNDFSLSEIELKARNLVESRNRTVAKGVHP